ASARSTHEPARLLRLRPRAPSRKNHTASICEGVVMSKKWIMLTGLLLPCFVGTLQAHPLDSPDIVYIDGQPCNSACQSYMAWSHRKFSVQHSAPVEAAPAESPPIVLVPEKPALRSTHNSVRRATAAPREN